MKLRRAVAWFIDSSLRVRGTVVDGRVAAVALGVIPACAGKWLLNAARYRCSPRHPCVCGAIRSVYWVVPEASSSQNRDPTVPNPEPTSGAMS